MQGPNTHSHFDLYAKVSEQKLKSNLCWSKLLTVEIAANNWLLSHYFKSLFGKNSLLSIKGKVSSPAILSSRPWGQSLHRKQTWSKVYPRVFQQTADVVKQKGKYIPFNCHVGIIRLGTMECSFSCTLLFLCNKDILSFLILQFRNQVHHATSTAIWKWQFKIAILWTLFLTIELISASVSVRQAAHGVRVTKTETWSKASVTWKKFVPLNNV